jgi:type I restriction enzyme, S subunit
LGEIATISTGPFGSLLHKSDYSTFGIPLVNPANIVGASIVPDSSKLISIETRERLLNYVLEVGDLVVGRRGEIGRCAVVRERENGWLCGTGSFFIRPSRTICSEFLAYQLRSPDYRDRLENSAVGTTMKNLSNSTLTSFRIAFPSRAEQQRIVRILDEAFAAIATAKANAEKNLQNARAVFESFVAAEFSALEHGWNRSEEAVRIFV